MDNTENYTGGDPHADAPELWSQKDQPKLDDNFNRPETTQFKQWGKDDVIAERIRTHSESDGAIAVMDVTNPLAAVKSFMELAGQLAIFGIPPEVKDPIRMMRRRMLADVKEGEVGEYLAGEFDNDAVEIGDGLWDVIVVAYGTLLSYFGPVATAEMGAEVARSNMDKVNGKHGPIVWKGQPYMSPVAKPKGWTGPDIRGILLKHNVIDEKGNLI